MLRFRQKTFQLGVRRIDCVPVADHGCQPLRPTGYRPSRYHESVRMRCSSTPDKGWVRAPSSTDRIYGTKQGPVSRRCYNIALSSGRRFFSFVLVLVTADIYPRLLCAGRCKNGTEYITVICGDIEVLRVNGLVASQDRLNQAVQMFREGRSNDLVPVTWRGSQAGRRQQQSGRIVTILRTQDSKGVPLLMKGPAKLDWRADDMLRHRVVSYCHSALRCYSGSQTRARLRFEFV
jgi:hypothetical protein